jgi:hypothetical protein
MKQLELTLLAAIEATMLTSPAFAQASVMEKRTGWGAEYPPAKRNGEWEFRAFNAHGVGEPQEPRSLLFCHKGQAQRDFVFTLDRMKSAN